ncbi:MAG TPA: ChbG/HpnK family deacetylase [Acidobacteriaceae bacterium]|nr:ChbG/HpnK family deacetylase [Acidobacteriaceae bacterium]
MKRLIVNADDFGLTPGVNAAVAELNEARALSSATLMASAPYFAAAVHLAFVQTSLAVGCHVILVDGTPVLPAREIPSLIDPDRRSSGRLRPTLGAFLRDLLRGRIREQEIEAEAAAQIRRVQTSGLHVTHVDTHKHTHVFRRVLHPLLRAAQSCGVLAIRNPFEPLWATRATRSAGAFRRMQVHALRTRSFSFARIARQNGLRTTDGAIGVLATGALDAAALRSLLRRMPSGAWELVCHPGYHDGALEQTRTQLRASREIERRALLEVIPEWLDRDPAFSLIDFGQLG